MFFFSTLPVRKRIKNLIYYISSIFTHSHAIISVKFNNTALDRDTCAISLILATNHKLLSTNPILIATKEGKFLFIYIKLKENTGLNIDMTNKNEMVPIKILYVLVILH